MMETKISLAVVVKVIIFVCSLLGVWYNTKYQVDSLNEKVEKLESHHETFNFGVIRRDIDYNRQHIEKLEIKVNKKK